MNSIGITTKVKVLNRTRITWILGTNRDEDYVASYVEENPDEFYGDNAEVYTVDELPDEAAIKQELLAAAETTPTVTTTQTRAPPTTRTVYVEKRHLAQLGLFLSSAVSLLLALSCWSCITKVIFRWWYGIIWQKRWQTLVR